MYAVKRTYGSKFQNFDWLQAWDEKWGTSCGTSSQKAMKFLTCQDAEKAAKNAGKVMKTDGFVGPEFRFVAVKV